MFDVFVQGSLVSGELDLITQAGYNTALVLETTASVIDEVSVELVPSKQNPIISAIEVLYNNALPPSAPVAPLPTAAPATLPPESYAVRINVGATGDWLDPFGRTWKADALTIGRAKTIDCQPMPISDTDMDTLYCSNKWFKVANAGPAPYVITVPVTQEGEFNVRLHFSETVSSLMYR